MEGRTVSNYRAIVLHEDNASAGLRPRRLSIEQRSASPCATGELRIEVERIGICGSDLGVAPAAGAVGSSVPLSVPPEGRVLGHEAIGRVHDTGPGVTGFAPGDWVTIESLLCCYRCDPCRRGHFNQCDKASLVGFQQDGAFAEFVTVPATAAHRLGELAESEEGRRAGACVEPAACSLLGLQAARLSPGSHVLILGGGPLGVFAAMLCRRVLGASRIAVIERSPFRRHIAGRWADEVFAEGELPARDGTRGFDLLFEAAGAMDVIERALPLLAPQAKVLLLSRGSAPLHLASVATIVTNGISLIGSRGHLGGVMEQVLSLARTGQLPLHEAVTGVEQELDRLLALLESPDRVIGEHCKLQVRI